MNEIQSHELQRKKLWAESFSAYISKMAGEVLPKCAHFGTEWADAALEEFDKKFPAPGTVPQRASNPKPFPEQQ